MGLILDGELPLIPYSQVILRREVDTTPQGPYRSTARVAQSPILFLLYTASLYKELGACKGLVMIGFSDDLNLIAV